MIATHEVPAFAFAVGEEVVVRLASIEAFDLAAATVAAPGSLPSWTIAAITARVGSDTRRLYAACFLHDDTAYLAVIDEAAIEGTA